MTIIITTLLGIGFMSLGIPQHKAMLHDLDMLAKDRKSGRNH